MVFPNRKIDPRCPFCTSKEVEVLKTAISNTWNCQSCKKSGVISNGALISPPKTSSPKESDSNPAAPSGS